MKKILEDPLGGWCIASHITGTTWTIIRGQFKTMKSAQAWLANYRRNA